MGKLKKYTLKLLFILLCVCILILYLMIQLPKGTRFESFKNMSGTPKYDIQYYVITMGQPKRLENIETQLAKLNPPIEIKRIDAINGDDLDLEKMVKDGKLDREVLTNNDKTFRSFGVKEKRKYEVGCYLSHQKAYKEIEANGNPNGFSIVLEDDFEIQPGFYEKLNEGLDYLTENKTDFDILFLGLKSEKNDHIGSNIYKPVCKYIYSCWYTHAVLINNKNISKILDKTQYIDHAIDIKIIDLSEKGKLNIFRIMPDIVNQNSPTTGSTIRD